MIQRLNHFPSALRAFGLCVLIALSAPVNAEDPVSLNFVDADIDSVVRAIGKVTGRNFVVDPRVKGTVNIVSNKPVSAELTYDILLSALRVQGFAAVDSNGVTLIIPEADAKLHYSGPGKGISGRGDRIVTEVIVVEYEAAPQLVPILRPLISPNNNIAAYAASNTLVITDYAENVRKIREIVATIDQDTEPEPVLIPLKHASVIDIAPLLTQMLGSNTARSTPGPRGSTTAQQPLLLVPDTRSNSLLVQAPTKAHMVRLRNLLDKLDVPAPLNGNMHVVYLKNAEADKLAKTLRAILTADTSSPTPSTSAKSATGAASPASTAPSETSTPGIIQADAATNSLIITAPEPTFNALRAIIDKLDMRRAQVFVEALIAEVSAEKATEFGVQWNTLSGVSGDKIGAIGGTNFTTAGSGTNILEVANSPTAAGRGLNIGIAKGQVTLPGSDTPILNLGALARALESDNRTNILSTPNLLTLDNEEAKIIVGQNVPFVTGSYAQTGSTATPTPFKTVERKDVGLTLKVKPLITEGGSVRLEVFQEVSSVLPGVSDDGPTTNKRSVESTVVVDDGDFVVLGGLIQDSLVRTADKVPFLGDLPLIGWLFRYETERRVKTNLMVFLRPVIVRAREGAHKITSGRYDYLIGEQDNLYREANTLFSNEGTPQLPLRDGVTGLPGSPSLGGQPNDGSATLPKPEPAEKPWDSTTD